MTDKLLSEVTPEDVEAARVAIEDELVEMRDARMFTGPHANGLVVREKDGGDSSIIRLGTRQAIQAAVAAILKAPAPAGARSWTRDDLFDQVNDLVTEFDEGRRGGMEALDLATALELLRDTWAARIRPPGD